jgi:two-component system OmpR family sensor kinase
MSEPEIFDTEAPAPPWRHRSERRRHFFQRLPDRTPLRTKLIVAVLGLVVIALAVISVASVYLLRSTLTTQYDTQLQAQFDNLVNAYNNGALTGTAGFAGSQGSNLVQAVQVPGNQLTWAPSGNYFPGANAHAHQPLPSLPTATDWAGTKGGVYVTVPAQSGPNSWRVLATTITYPVTTSTGTQQETSTLIVAVDLGDVSALTNRLAVFDLVVGGAILVVVAIVGVAVVQANLRPLNDIEMTAGQIAKGHLDHRVPEGDPRTEVGSLGRSLNAMLAQIERAFHAQEESEQAAHESEERMRRFIADASHELRTPLTTIRGFAAHYRMRGGAGGRPPVSVGAGAAGGAGTAVGGGGGAGAAVGDGGAQDQSSRTDAFVPESANGISPSGPDDDGMSPADLDHLIGRVEAEATRMGLLVEDLLTLARLDQQRPLNVAPVDVLTLAVDAVQDARIVSPGRQIDLVVAPGTAFLVNGDESRLRQVLGNLVNNALTHTPAGTPVRVKIAAGTLPPAADGRTRGPAPAGGGGFAGGAEGTAPASGEPVPAVVLDVEDDGPGMPAEQAQRVFERFYRADAARNRASGGTGLGLAIVAGLVSAHGGTVAVRTAPGQGADFQVRLPLSPDALASSDDPDDTLPD